ncbi:Phosphatidylglycerol/phosphatidylinositol transfer protein [Boothiomyces macroporosus]|uniref:Phosphatidylglycerol/phosphatidylinositol transfer protein n=1 Tax=Boothiomyces macroporosus TaxID=261099 RepID=A0AAD5Y7M4_9FUNG|nr:Phosphatidylglycerol/phosphatidylinositol transfer protein [Boothiomyces macroporosus]
MLIVDYYNMKFTALFAAAASVSASTNIMMKNIFQDPVAPLSSCGGSSDTLTVQQVTLAPYPIPAGQPIVIAATGSLSSTITQGTVVNVAVKLGFIPLINKKLDFCAEAAKVNISCPIAPGPQQIQLTEVIPSSAPAGTFDLHITVDDPSNNEIVCLSGKVQIVKP